ncbi:substrate-binding periplasmic protein [Streptomyces sp. NPDC002643]
MLKRTTTALAVTALAAGFLTACGSTTASTVADDCEAKHEFKTLTEGTLTVSTYDLPPFTKVEGAKLTGVDGDILDAVAEMECVELKIAPAAAAAVIPAVLGGRADLAAGDWYRTAERAEVAGLTDPVYTDQMGIISSDGISDITAMKGKKVGTVDGYLWVADLKKYLGGSLRLYNSPLNMYQDMEAGRIDIAVDSYGSGVYNVGEDDLKVKVAESFEEVAASTEGAQSTFPVRKNSTDLLKALNEDIAELRESGRLAEILKENDLDESAAEPGEARLIGD